MEKIAEMYGPYSLDTENEDVFFSRKVHLIKGARLPSHATAYSFCKEVEIKDYPDVNHTALHAAWYYSHVSAHKKLKRDFDAMRSCFILKGRGLSSGYSDC